MDIVVNNAGLPPNPMPVAAVSEAEFELNIRRFWTRSYFVMQEAARALPDGGRIINISTVVTAILPPFASLYAGSKAALEAFSGVIAAELAPRKITVNCVLSGPVETRMIGLCHKNFKDVEQRTPLGLGEPRDIAGVVAFLASDEGHWITNEKIRCDGGIR